MPFILTPDTFESLWQESEQNGQASCPDTDTDFIDQAILPHIGRFRECHTPLQPGLELSVREWELPIDLLFMDDVADSDSGDDSNFGAGLIFNLSGKVQTNMHSLTGEIEEVVGYHHLENGVGLQETELWRAGEPFLRVYLLIDPVQLFGHLTGLAIAQLPVEVQRSLEGHHRPYYRVGITTPAMNQVLGQILHCPYEGLLRHMYLQGKAWELMALYFEQCQANAGLSSGLSIGRLKPSDIERIHRAKAILTNQLDAPPSLATLASLVELNEFTLKQGFRQVFGTTPFQYLHSYRLDQARRLLETGDRSILEVVKQVGFSSRGCFAAAFRKKFGLTPKAYQLSRTNFI